ncbi:MAG: virulence protein, partial [Gammaproteobacteria bacterium]|nr:virulence protein [Gammaproteobacteria bacterium]
MSLSGRARWIILAGIGTCAAGLLLWLSFTKPSLEESTVVLRPAAGVAAPAGRDDVLTILYSGDGGWADLDRQLGEAFAARGIPVLGVNVFRYFWRERSPRVAAAQLDALMTKYLNVWHKQRVWLVGFSFGADVLPTLIGGLDPANRARIAQVVLLAPGRD